MEAMYRDSGMKLTLLRVDGGMAANNLLMQMQSDLVGMNVGWCNALYHLLAIINIQVFVFLRSDEHG